MASFDTIASGVADDPGACDAPNLPEATLHAAADHAQFGMGTSQGSSDYAAAVLAPLPRVGVDYEEAMSTPERGGVQKFGALALPEYRGMTTGV